MVDLIAKLLSTIRYRRRWRILAAAAKAAADKASMELDQHVRDRGRRRCADRRPPLERSSAPRIRSAAGG